MNRLGRLENFNLGMGLSMTPGQVIAAPHATLDGLDMSGSKKYLLFALLAVGLYYLGRHG